MDDQRDELGEGTGRQGPWAADEDGPRASKQQGDPHALDVEGDPRGGVGSDEYRHADPRDLTREGETTMSGPAGAPQEGTSVEERREESNEVMADRPGRASATSDPSTLGDDAA
ncbi:MAG: hypothetical protein ABR521_03555 [Gaiellaceae bacterium]